MREKRNLNSSKIRKLTFMLFFLANITFCFGQKIEDMLKLTVNGSTIYVNEEDYSEQIIFPELHGIEIMVWYPDGRALIDIYNKTQKKIKLEYEIKYQQACLREDNITKEHSYFVDTTVLFTKKGTLYLSPCEEDDINICSARIFSKYHYKDYQTDCYDSFSVSVFFKEIIINYTEE